MQLSTKSLLQCLAILCFAITMGACGCQSKQPFVAHHPSAVDYSPAAIQQVNYEEIKQPETLAAQTPEEASSKKSTQAPPTPALLEGEPSAEALSPVAPPTLDELATSVRLHFPAIQSAIAGRTIASGEALAARGAFDHKLEGFSESQPLDFYENYRQSLGVKRDTYWGGQTFAGYRIGRGIYEPWYLERETNKGGEFKTGFVVPLARDRGIDANRAELWRAQLEQGRIEPEIRSLVILTIRDANIAYWQWVAAAANYEIAEGVLQLGLDRIGYLEKQVAVGEKAEIDLVDNRRIILSRQAKLQDALRKLKQTAAKLSLYLRNGAGRPIVLNDQQSIPEFPLASAPGVWGEAADIASALANRPELTELQIVRRQLNIALRQACNETRPEIDAGLLVAQDVGEPTSSKQDKSEFELEASLMVSVPIQRRKALGKVRQLRGKLAQVRAKTRFAADKIAIEAQAAHAALVTSALRVSQTTESLKLAQQMQKAEQRLYEFGQSTLFNLNLREKQAADAAVERIAALFDYHAAVADYAAALGAESLQSMPMAPPEPLPPLPEASASLTPDPPTRAGS